MAPQNFSTSSPSTLPSSRPVATAFDLVSPPTTSSGVNDQILVYHVDLFILCIFALFFLVKVPHALARFYSAQDWSTGHFLRRVEYPGRPTRPHFGEKSSSGDSVTEDSQSDDDSRSYTSAPAASVSASAYTYTARPRPKTKFPHHVGSVPKFLRGYVILLRKRIAPGFSFGQLIVLTGWFATLFYAGFYHSDQMPFLDPFRAGWIAIAQIPFVFLFAMKNSIIGWLFGSSYDKLNYVHRFIGRAVVLATNIHALDYFFKWELAGTFSQQIRVPDHLWGMVALVAVDMLWVFSIQWCREKMYNVFYLTHIAGVLALFPAIWFHFKGLRPYFLVSIGIYVLDYFLRILKTRFTTATIKPVRELGATRVECYDLTAGWRAGQHVRLRIWNGMGWRGWWESHPFTIASLGGKSGEGLVLLCKKVGGWSDRLYELAEERKGYGGGRNVKVMIEGPYGGTGHLIFTSFSATVLVCGGSGISFGMGVLQDMIDKDLRGECRVKVVRLVWIVPEPQALVPILGQFESLVGQSLYMKLRIDVFYTRAPTGKFPFQDGILPRNIHLCPGRPGLGKVFDDVIGQACRLDRGGVPMASAKNKGPLRGMVIGVCGPRQLSDDVTGVVGRIEPIRRNQVGGVEIFEEIFGY